MKIKVSSLLSLGIVLGVYHDIKMVNDQNKLRKPLLYLSIFSFLHFIYIDVCKFIIETDTPYDELNNVIIKETKTVLLTFDYMIVVYFYLAASICIDFVR